MNNNKGYSLFLMGNIRNTIKMNVMYFTKTIINMLQNSIQIMLQNWKGWVSWSFWGPLIVEHPPHQPYGQPRTYLLQRYESHEICFRIFYYRKLSYYFLELWFALYLYIIIIDENRETEGIHGKNRRNEMRWIIYD